MFYQVSRLQKLKFVFKESLVNDVRFLTIRSIKFMNFNSYVKKKKNLNLQFDEC